MTSSNDTSTQGYSLFWPLLVLVLGFAFSETYQVLNLEAQRAELVQANEQIGSQVKRAVYEQAKREALAREILRLSKTNTNAAQIVTEFKIKEVPIADGAASATVNPPADGK